MPGRIPYHRPPGVPGNRQAYERSRPRREDIAFYQSPAWLKLRRLKLRSNPLCERCEEQGLTTPAKYVHHVLERKARPDLALDLENLESLCGPCHSSHYASRQHRGGG